MRKTITEHDDYYESYDYYVNDVLIESVHKEGGVTVREVSTINGVRHQTHYDSKGRLTRTIIGDIETEYFINGNKKMVRNKITQELTTWQ